MAVRIVLSLLLLLVAPTLAFGQGRDVSDASIAISLPRLTWALEIRTGGFVTKRDETRDGGRARYFFATNERTGLHMSVRLERGIPSQSSARCRDDYWANLKQRSPLKMDDVKISESGKMAILEYAMKEYQGFQMNTKSLHAFLAKDDVCVHIHVSKVQFQPEDQALFTSIVKSVRITEPLPTTR